MRKSNLITMLILGFFVLGAFSFGMVSKSMTKTDKKTVQEKPVSEVRKETVKPQEKKKEEIKQDEKQDTEHFSMENTLFIGDSRTVGLMEYSKIKGPDFFCTVGMSVFNIFDDAISVPNVGKVTLSELLTNKKYDKIYIMLGVNEMGYRFENIIQKYKELLTFIKQKEPSTLVFLQANLHVTGERSNTDDTFNNHAINKLNTALSKMANGKDIFYLDANVLFDDENGDLSSDKSSDTTHLYAKYYEVWGKWIVQQSALLVKEE